MKKKYLIRILVITISFLLLFSSIQYCVKAEPQPSSGIDVVFALDASISMTDSDPQNLRYEAIRLYMDMCSSAGSRVGIAAYGGSEAGERALSDISTNTQKEDIINYLNQLQLVPYTDTGIGLKKALQVLEGSGDTVSKRVIVLLSDGKNEPERSYDDCTKDTQTALETAKSKGYPIYTIGLNADGTVDNQLLESLSTQTGGKSYITSAASDLNGIIQEIYTDNTTSKKIDSQISGSDGSTEAEIDIPNDSVKEATITVLHKQNATLKLLNPSGQEVSIPSDSVTISQSSTYSLLKLIKPVKGKWKLDVSSDMGEQISINYVLSYELSAFIEASPDSINKGDTVSIQLYLVNASEKVQDASQYEGMEGLLYIYGGNDDLITQQSLKLNEAGNMFTGEFTPDEVNSYKIEGIIQGKIFYSKSNAVNINMENTKPEYKGSDKTIKLKIGKEQILNLDSYFYDGDGELLSYTASCNNQDLHIQISGNKLILKADKKLKCSVLVSATDKNQGSIDKTLQVQVSDKNIIDKALAYLGNFDSIQLLMIVIPAIIAIIIIIVIKAVMRKNTRKKNTRGGIITAGQIMLNVIDQSTGELLPPQFIKLKNYTKGVTIYSLMSSLPEYSETERIKLFASNGGIISIKNDSECIITKDQTSIGKGKSLELNANDTVEIKLSKIQKVIRIKYIP